MGDVTRMDDVVSVAIWGMQGVGCTWKHVNVAYCYQRANQSPTGLYIYLAIMTK